MTEESRAAQIARVMAAMGFSPSGKIDARFVEYHKDYAEPHGRVARCTAVFNKGGVIAHMDHAQLEGFVVTVQGSVSPILEDIAARAPRIMHGDMKNTLLQLEGIGAPEAGAVEVIKCESCGKDTAEFVLSKSAKRVCPECMIHTVGK